MIQRIQSVYLFLIATLMVAAAFFPIIEVVPYEGFSASSPEGFNMFALGEYSFLPASVSPALSIFVGIMAFITIFLYNKRKLQIKLCIWMIVLIFIVYISIFYSYSVLLEKMNENTTFFPQLGIAFPLVAFTLVFMAIAGIRKDDRIISTLDRLR